MKYRVPGRQSPLPESDKIKQWADNESLFIRYNYNVELAPN